MAKKTEGKDFLPIGTWVCFSRRVVVDYGNRTQRDFKNVECGPDALDPNYYRQGNGQQMAILTNGQIVGGKWLRRGVTDRTTYYDDYPPSFVSTDKSLFVYLVRVGFTNKPIWVMPEEAQVIPDPSHEKMPFFYQHWPEQARESMRREMKQIEREGLLPRDDKGRFVPVNS